MKILALIVAFMLPFATFAATISGEATFKTVKKTGITTVKAPVKPITSTSTKTASGTKTSTPVKVATKYFSGPKGGCYFTQKDKKTGKMVKKYVDKKFCTK